MSKPVPVYNLVKASAIRKCELANENYRKVAKRVKDAPELWEQEKAAEIQLVHWKNFVAQLVEIENAVREEGQ